MIFGVLRTSEYRSVVKVLRTGVLRLCAVSVLPVVISIGRAC
jgi:hypothetical protein